MMKEIVHPLLSRIQKEREEGARVPIYTSWAHPNNNILSPTRPYLASITSQ
jgi:hypothetical protein